MGDKDKAKGKDYTLKGASGKNHQYKIKIWGKCTVLEVKDKGKVSVQSHPDCPFDTWSADCKALDAKLRPLSSAIDTAEQVHQVYVWILTIGRRADLEEGKRKEWETAVGGWKKNVDVKAKRLADQRAILFQNFNSACDEFYNNKVEPLITHALDKNLKPHVDGTRRHRAYQCTEALAAIPPAFFYSTAGKDLATKLAQIYHKKTSQTLKSDRLALFVASDYRDASAAELLDSTVFEASLLLMDHFLPAAASQPGFTLQPRGFLEFMTGKKFLGKVDLTKASWKDLRKLPDKIVISANIGIHGMDFQLETLERADQFRNVAINNVLNTIAFLGAMDELSRNKSFYSKTKGVKVTADLISSLAKLSELKSIRMVSKGAGVIGLGLDGALASMDAAKQYNLSSERDDRRLLAGANIVKAVGACLMIVSLPVGAAIYLLGTLGVIALDHDPFAEWAKSTYFGAEEYQSKRFSSSKEALAELQRILKIES